MYGPNTTGPLTSVFSLEVNFPFSEDGHHVHTAAYRIVALVTHQGVDHHTGHYQSLLLMDKAVWLADDGQYPVPIGQVTTQHQREVLQLWLVKEPADELVADTHAEYVEPHVKKARHAHDTLTLLFANGRGHEVMPSSSCMRLTWQKLPPPGPCSTTPTEAGRPMARLPTLLAKEGTRAAF